VAAVVDEKIFCMHGYVHRIEYMHCLSDMCAVVSLQSCRVWIRSSESCGPLVCLAPCNRNHYYTLIISLIHRHT
jgi:hypothetical protein